MWRALLVLACAVVAFATYAAIARWVLHGPVTPASLGISLDREVGSGGLSRYVDDCVPMRRVREWRCDVVEPEVSGGARYRVRTERGGSCWTAVRIEDYSEGPMPPRGEGCVHRWQWSGLDLLRW